MPDYLMQDPKFNPHSCKIKQVTNFKISLGEMRKMNSKGIHQSGLVGRYHGKDKQTTQQMKPSSQLAGG